MSCKRVTTNGETRIHHHKDCPGGDLCILIIEQWDHTYGCEVEIIIEED
jgi:hypothetical protein